MMTRLRTRTLIAAVFSMTAAPIFSAVLMVGEQRVSADEPSEASPTASVQHDEAADAAPGQQGVASAGTEPADAQSPAIGVETQLLLSPQAVSTLHSEEHLVPQAPTSSSSAAALGISTSGPTAVASEGEAAHQKLVMAVAEELREKIAQVKDAGPALTIELMRILKEIESGQISDGAVWDLRKDLLDGGFTLADATAVSAGTTNPALVTASNGKQASSAPPSAPMAVSIQGNDGVKNSVTIDPLTVERIERIIEAFQATEPELASEMRWEFDYMRGVAREEPSKVPREETTSVEQILPQAALPEVDGLSPDQKDALIGFDGSLNDPVHAGSAELPAATEKSRERTENDFSRPVL